MTEIKAIKVNARDNVANALTEMKVGEIVVVESGNKKLRVIIKSNIPFGHKFATKKILKDEEVIKYGEVIGKATQNIKMGEHVHIHNVVGLRARGDLKRW